MNNIYYIDTSKLEEFINKLKDSYSVFAPAVKDPDAKESDYFYKNFNPAEPLIFNAYRAIEPLKVFFTYPKEVVSEYFSSSEPGVGSGKAVIFGVKSCDIVAHKFQDFVFLEGTGADTSAPLSINGKRSRTIDSLYRLRRENIILVSSDCTDFKGVCHCLAWEILPHPTTGFDLNLSPLNDGYVLEAGSKKGEDLIQQHKEYFVAAKDTQVVARQVKRDNLIERLKRHLLPQRLVSKGIVQRLVKEGYGLDTWQQFMLTCVECGGCNFICDTCHCFLLADKNEGNINKRVKAWDSCLYANYARVAAGANPLKTRTQRLRFRFTKKFDFFVDNLGMPACCGCGRCIEVCPAKIDIREVLKDLAKKLNINT